MTVQKIVSDMYLELRQQKSGMSKMESVNAVMKNCPLDYIKSDGTPVKSWENAVSKLKSWVRKHEEWDSAMSDTK